MSLYVVEFFNQAVLHAIEQQKSKAHKHCKTAKDESSSSTSGGDEAEERVDSEAETSEATEEESSPPPASEKNEVDPLTGHESGSHKDRTEIAKSEKVEVEQKEDPKGEETNLKNVVANSSPVVPAEKTGTLVITNSTSRIVLSH